MKFGFDATFDWFVAHKTRLGVVVGILASFVAVMLPFYSPEWMKIVTAVLAWASSILAASGQFKSDDYHQVKQAVEQGKLPERRQDG